ncbi:hypothetical protein ACWEQL_18365 [Kitasatospora sp. NPDC004240]
MGEIVGELMALFADGFVRRLAVARARRRFEAGRPVRIRCSARSRRPGWPRRTYANGALRITPGAATVTFGSRVLGHTPLAVGGTFQDPEPDDWYDQDWGSTAYLPPDGGHPVHLQVDSRHLPLLHLALAGAPVEQEVTS